MKKRKPGIVDEMWADLSAKLTRDVPMRVRGQRSVVVGGEKRKRRSNASVDASVGLGGRVSKLATAHLAWEHGAFGAHKWAVQQPCLCFYRKYIEIHEQGQCDPPSIDDG